MSADMGKRIREYRLKKGMTQEQLASALNLSAQAVSKWENGVTLPDIGLLPELSALFGVSIDGLFSLSDDTRFDRIDSMLAGQDSLAGAEYEASEAFLKEKIKEELHKGRALTMLADLNNHRARSFRRAAEYYAKRALEAEPEKKANHSLLCEAFGGVVWDWCCTNHHEQIAFYQDFVAKHPAYQRGYLWLLEMLLADRRIGEAEQTLERMRRVQETYHAPLYAGYIAAAKGDFDAAEAHWARMVEDCPDTWLSWSARGDAYARYGRYDKAIDNYRKAMEIHEPPRFTDNCLSIAHLSEITGDWATAADSYEQVLAILRDDWKVTEGDGVERYKALAAQRRLQAK